MAYRHDPDLDFLGTLSSEELDNLVKILTLDKEGNALLTENLTYSEQYKLYHPEHKMYWKDIAEELQLFGGNTFMNLLKGNKGVFYKEILCDVCDKLKVNYNKTSATIQIEQNLLMKILQDSLEKMSPDEIATLANELGIENKNGLTPQAMGAAFLAIFRAGGFKSYQLTLIVVNAVMKTLFGHMLPPIIAGGVAGRIAGILSGPIGWIITGVWTAIDLAGPAYRITIPAVIQVAYLRSLSINRQAVEANCDNNNGEENVHTESSPKKEKSVADISREIISNELYDPDTTDFKRVKSLLNKAENWSDEEKKAHIKAVYYSRTGMSGWDYISPDSTEVIWELAKKEKLRNIYKQAAALLPESEEAQDIYRVLALAEKRRQSWVNPTYNRNQTPSVKFSDFGFKLAVVNELMFNQEKLIPKFELQAFLDEDSEQCINACNGDVYKSFLYALPFNPFQNIGMGMLNMLSDKPKPIYNNTFGSVIHYFEQLDIPAALFSNIEKIEIKRDMPIYHNMLVTLNGEISITDDAKKDLNLLPNLKSILISDEVVLSAKIVAELKARQIDLIIEQNSDK